MASQWFAGGNRSDCSEMAMIREFQHSSGKGGENDAEPGSPTGRKRPNEQAKTQNLRTCGERQHVGKLADGNRLPTGDGPPQDRGDADARP